MERERWMSRKVVIVGAGAVGSTFAYALAQRGLADEIALVDLSRELVEGQVLDLAHGMPFFPTVRIKAGEYDDCADAHVVVITAGAAQKQGESRLGLLQRNARIIEEIVEKIVESGSRAVIVVVSNPVDIMTYVALRKSGWKRGRVLGSGTVLDSARFRYLLSRHCDVDIHNIHAYILGEHGDSEFAAWSMSHIAGMDFDEYCPVCGRCDDWQKERPEIVQMVKDSAYHVINYKGATYFAVGMALVQITGAILRNQRSVLTVSTLLEGEYGLEDVCLSVPAIVTQEGVERIVEGDLSGEEMEALSRSASVLQEALSGLGGEG